MLPELVAGAFGFGVVSLLLPLIIKWARGKSLLDVPDDDRRRHAAPTPRLGGIAVFLAMVLAGAAVFAWDARNAPALGQVHPLWIGFLIGASIVFAIGLIDDIRGVSPLLKLLGHSTAALIVVAYGFHVDAVTLAGNRTIALGNWAIPITVLWIVGITNAFNLIDGVDGLASTFALIGLCTVAVAEILVGRFHHPLTVVAVAAGAMFAFLRYNRAPAKVFLGDAGSTTLGFFLSIQLWVSATTPDDVTYALVPLFALAYPITDTTIAIARRWLRGHKFSRADGRHIHHQLLAIGISPQRTVDILAVVFSAVALMGISIALAPPRVTFALVIAGSILLFTLLVYAVRWLGYHEFSALGSSIVSVVVNARGHIRRKIIAGDVAAELGRARSVEELRRILNDCAEELGFLEVSMESASMPYVGPSFQQISPIDKRPFRIDCPVAWTQPDGEVQEAILRFWCARPAMYRYVGAERLIARVVPAVQQWLVAHPPGENIAPAVRRTSGATRVLDPAEREINPSAFGQAWGSRRSRRSISCAAPLCLATRRVISSPMASDAVAAGLGALSTWRTPGPEAKSKS